MTMKLSKRTIDILKNFATINQSIVVSEGNKLLTMSVARNIVGEVTVEETFPKEFAIYNLNEFLSAISLFTEPELNFEDKCVMIRESGAKKGGIKYFYSNKSLIVHPSKSISKVPTLDAEFILTEEHLNKLNRAANVLGVGDLVVAGDEEGLSMVVQNRKNASSNDFELVLSVDPVDEPFKFYFKQENFKFIPNDYKVEISAKGIAIFSDKDGLMKYAVALEAE